MKSRFLPVKEGDTVLNYYALPLVSMNRKYFGSNLISTKVTHDGRTVFVALKEDIYNDDGFPHKVIEEEVFYLYFKVPKEYVQDMLYVIAGMYSKMSDEAKGLIILNSGLAYNKKRGSEKYTSKLLFALTKNPSLINYYYEQLKSGDSKADDKLYAALLAGELTEKVRADDLV